MSLQPQSSFITSVRVFLHAMLPSSASIIIGFIAALVIMGGHVLLVTLNGEIRPAAFDDQVFDAYTSNIIDPLLRLTNSSTLNNGLGILLWGLFGWTLYAGVAFVANSVSEWHMARQEVRIDSGTIVNSPMHRPLIVRFIWRFVAAVCLVVYTMLVLPVMHYCLTNDWQMLVASDITEALPYFFKSLAVWLLLFHGYLVLLRLYVMRTRIFGEILY